jgi:hypothetical protein
MLKYREKIEAILRDGYNYIIVPNVIINAPIQLETMKKEDDSYATVNELSEHLGKQFKTILLKNGYVGYRWAYDIGVDEHKHFANYLESNGHINMRDENGEFNWKLENGYAMCDIRTFRDLPRRELND